MRRQEVFGVIVILVTALQHCECQVCPFGWVERPGSDTCYLINTDTTRYKYDEASDKCHSYQGELVTISTQEESRWLFQQLDSAHKAVPVTRNWWMGIRYQDGGYVWINGTSVNNSLLPWQAGLPGNTTGPCVAVKDGAVVNSNCFEWYNLLCSRPKGVPLPCDVDNGWIFVNDSCFKVFNEQRVWEDAKQLCEMQNAALASLHTFTEHSELWDTARRISRDLWIGLSTQQVSGGMELVWSDGSALDPGQTFWANDSEPVDLAHRNNSCTYIDGSGPRRLKSWHLTNCTDFKGYACQKPQGVCEDGWLTHQTNCFKIFNSKASWSYAHYTCFMIGGDLLMLAVPSDQQFIQRYIPEIKADGFDSFWIGLSDNRDDYGPLKWIDGTEVGNVSTHWAQSAPPSNTVGNYDCGYIDTSDPEGRWQMTSDCTQNRAFICTISVNTPVKPLPMTTPSTQCESGLWQYKDRCYYFSVADKTWADSRQVCTQSLGGDLAVITSSDEQAFVNGLVTGADYWIGLTDQAKEGTWVWVDGSPLQSYLHWAQGEPNALGEEDCVAIFGTRGTDLNGRWNDYDCAWRFHFICQKPATARQGTTLAPTTTTKVVWSAKCGAFWEERPGSDYCYQFHDDAKTFADARTECQAHNGSLVSIVDYAEQSYLAGRVRSMSSSTLWIGASDFSSEGGWSWDDDAPFAYINWNPGEPNDMRGNEDCGVILTQNSRWNDFACDLQMGYICKKLADTYTTTPAPATTPLPSGKYYSCPTGWKDYRSSCYQTHTTKMSWTAALSSCHTQGGDLASIADQQENDFIVSMLPRVICNNTHGNDDECAQWAEQGECDQNPLWMGLNCRHACDKCHEPCVDIHNHHQCQVWSRLGECAKNPSWMLTNCALSCLVCDGGTDAGWWMGLNDRNILGSFAWSDTSPVTFANWRSQSPRSMDRPACGTLDKSTGSWVDMPCTEEHGYVCKKPTTVNSVTPLSPFSVGCPANALGYQSFCYQFADTYPMTWDDSEKYCVSMHGHLATINAVTVQFFVAAELVSRKQYSHYWVGLNDHDTPGVYKWSSGQSLVYTAWSSNHTGNERDTCMGLRTERPMGLWENVNCSTLNPFVCELPRRGYTTTTTTTPATTTTPTPCSDDWVGFEDNCYRAFTGIAAKRNWADARDFCRNYGADLPSIHNASLNDFFRDTLLRSAGFLDLYWIGLTDADKESTYMWSDGTPFDYAAWYVSEPNNYGGNEDCTEYSKSTNHWNDNSCYITNYFICSIPRGKPLVTTLQPPTTTPVPMCDGTQWLSKGGYCYYVSAMFGTDSKKTWFQARRFCQENGADLASIDTESTNSFLVTYLTKRDRVNTQYWMGLNRLGGGQYRWTDGSAVVYENWAESEPNDAYGGQACVNLYSMSGKWNDDNCMDEYHFICKRVNASAEPYVPVPTPIIPGGCPRGFSGVGNRCYYVGGLNGSETLNWTAGRDACRAMQAAKPVEIAAVTSKQEQAFLMTLLENSTDDVYIGLNDQHVNQYFVWQSNEEVTFTNWADGQPSETWVLYGSGKEDCVLVQVDEKNFGKWNDVNCGDLHGYVCQTLRDTSYPKESPVSGKCKSDYHNYRDSCYGTYTMAKNWTDAQSTCTLDGGQLVSIRDVHELAFLATLLPASDKVVTGAVWTGMSFDATHGDYYWIDGWPVTFTQWDSGEPNLQTAGSCVTMENGVWSDRFCNETHPFVCKITSVKPPPTTPPPPGYCANNTWAPNGDFCYYTAPQNARSWPEANYLCGKMGMELLSLHSMDELMFVQSLLKLATTTMSFRYNSFLYQNRVYQNRVWLGMQRTVEGGFRWSDGSAADFFQWNTGEPNNMNNEEDCAELLVDSGKWNDMPCIGNDRGFVCKTPKIMPSSTSTTSTSSTTTSTTVTITVPSTQAPQTVPPPAFATTNSFVPVTQRKPPTTPSGVHINIMTARSTGTNNSSSTLTGGQIAGIIIGLFGLVIFVGAIVFVFRRRTTRSLPAGWVESATGFDNALYVKKHEEVSMSVPSNGISNGSNKNGLVNHADEEEDC